MAHVQARLIERMLGDARPDAPPAQDSVDLTEIVDTAVTALRPLAESRRIVLVNRNLSKPAWSTGDQDRLLQLFWNLLSNAIELSDTGASVFVAVDRRGAEIVVAVQDGAPGIDRAGLSTAKQIVVAHGGTISAASNGTGSVFTVRLPETPRRSEAQVLGRGTPPISQRTEKLARRRILLVEENDEVRNAIAAMLLRGGARVTATGTVDHALAAFQAGTPDLVIGAPGMTDPDGVALLALLEERSAGQRFTAIALLDDCAGEAPERARAAGYQACVPRSATGPELMAAVASACGPRRD
jgi:CheY-like chemotaxis protein